MPSEIERLLIAKNQVSVITGIVLRPQELAVSIATAGEWGPETTARFVDATIVALSMDADEDGDFNLPWDIIGIEAQQLTTQRYRFVLNCRVIEVIFDAAWPTTTRSTVTA